MLYFSQFGDKCTTHITKKQMGGVKDVKRFIFFVQIVLDK